MSTRNPTPGLLQTFAEAPSDQARAELVAGNVLLRSPETITALCDRATHLARQDLASARKSAEAALWLGEVLGHKPSLALARRTLGNIIASLGEPAEAFFQYSTALKLFQDLGDRHQAAITRSSALSVAIDAKGAETALEWAEKARLVFRESGDQLRLARLENNLAVMFFRQENFLKAQEHWLAAHNTLDLIGETLDQATTLRNLAVCSISLNQPVEAKRYYRQARKLCEQHSFTFLLHAIDYNIAYLHYLEGDHHRALKLYQAARSRSRELGDSYHEAYCSLDETEVYVELNLLDEANTVAHLAATQFKSQKRPYEEAKALFNLALVRSRRGEPRAALSHLESASQAIRGQGNILWPGQVELLRAAIFDSEGRFFEARRAAEIAHGLFQDSGFPRRAALSELLLAKTCLSQGDPQNAEQLCRTAQGTLEGFGEPDSLFQAFLLLGRILDSKGDSSAAETAFRRAEEYLLELRERRSAARMRISLFDQPLELYSDLISLLIDRDHDSWDLPEIFRLTQAAKARSLADLTALSSGRAPRPTAMRSQLVDQVSTLREELNWLYRRLDRSELPHDSAAPSAIESLQRQSQAKESELAHTLSRLRARNTDTDMDPEKIGTTKVAEIQASLQDSCLLEFFVAHDVVAVLLISEDRCLLHPLSVASKVRDLQRRLWHYLNHPSQENHSRVSGARSPAIDILGELYSELLQPLEEFIGDMGLIIAPHEFLFQLPFHAFITGSDFVIDRRNVSYVPSATDLARALSSKATSARQIEVIGDPKSTGQFVARLRADNPADQGLIVQTEDPGANSRGAAHLLSKVALRSDNPLFSSIQIGARQHILLDLFRSKLLHPIVTLEGDGFAPSTSDGHREVQALWNGLLNSGAMAAILPSGSSSPPIHREHARLVYAAMLQGCRSAAANRQASVTMRDQGAGLSDWSSLYLIGSPFLRLTPARTGSRTTSAPD